MRVDLAPVTTEQIRAACRRAFGVEGEPVAIEELGGGTVNRVYRIVLDGGKVVLRLAPPPSADLTWDEQWLMRREWAIQPFFASVADLMPHILFADFTHKIVDRDYMFQTLMPGERWDALDGQLAEDARLALWEQFGAITRRIHDTAGSTFAGPYPNAEYDTWSGAVIGRLQSSVRAMVDAGLDQTDLRAVLAIVERQRGVLDQIKQPHLLHGDLWLVNILVETRADRPAISGILDADRASWGDPLADWTMFVLSKNATPESRPFHERFWQGYGRVEESTEAEFRGSVYEAMHVGTALVWAHRHGNRETVERGRRDLAACVARLAAFA